jgi:phosphatidate cytidylyltransferase
MASSVSPLLDTDVAQAVQELLAIDALTTSLLLIVIGLLLVVFGFMYWLKHRYRDTLDPAMIKVFNRRIAAWLTIYTLLGLTVLAGPVVTLVFFGCISFQALREFVTMAPTRRADHRTLFWVFCVFIPLQYVLAAYSGDRRLFTAFAVLIPVYGSLFISARIAFANEAHRFLERTAKIQFGLLICVYALSHAPALLYLDLVHYQPSEERLATGTVANYLPWTQSKSRLLFFLVLMVQLSDLLQFFWDRLYGKNLIAANINPTKSWEGLVGAALCCGAAALILQWLTGVTPFTTYGAAIMGMVISVMAISGTMTMSAIKRDRGVSDYGTLVQGHAGVLDRIDAICFSAPIFYHLTRFFLGAGVD